MASSKNNTSGPVSKRSTTNKAKSWKRGIRLTSKKSQFLAFIFCFALIGGVYLAFRSYAATPCRSQVLQSGSKGECVRLFQNAINVNQPGRLVEDGAYGAKSKLAAEDTQRFWGLTVDGKAGPKTAEALCYGLALNGKSAAYCNGATAGNGGVSGSGSKAVVSGSGSKGAPTSSYGKGAPAKKPSWWRKW